jgi:hypothetical protein
MRMYINNDQDWEGLQDSIRDYFRQPRISEKRKIREFYGKNTSSVEQVTKH